MWNIKFTKALSLKVFVAILVLVKTLPAYSQVNGCKDPLANNYNAAATVNDGSCAYNVTNYTPPVKVNPLSSTLIENSGLQWAGNSLWSFNDGGGAAAIYRIDTVTSTIFQTVTLSGATNVDWEDIAFDGTYFYVGDFGNNANGARTDLKIYKFPISAIPDYVSTPNATIAANQVEVINFIYSDQAQPPVAISANATKFDCEAMIVDAGNIHLFSKNWIGDTTTHYIINSIAAGNYTAAAFEKLRTDYLITAADKALGQQTIVLFGYQASGTATHFMSLLNDYSGGNFFNGNNRKITLPDATVMGQGEGITFRNATYGYMSNERFQYPFGQAIVTVNQRLRSFDVNNLIAQYLLPLGALKTFTVSNVNGMNKIAWDFESSVSNVSIQYSSDGVNFSNLKSYSNSSSDFLLNKPAKGVSYYRMAWLKGDQVNQYSNVIAIKNETQTAISNLLLKANGELSFIVNGNEQDTYAFELVSSDGKLISRMPAGLYKSGLNKISFANRPPNNVALITVYNGGQKTTTMLHVAK